MSTIIAEKTFSHFDDCVMSGCPTHVMRASHQTTSDYFTVEVEGEHLYSGDDSTTRTMLTLIHNVDYSPDPTIQAEQNRIAQLISLHYGLPIKEVLKLIEEKQS